MVASSYARVYRANSILTAAPGQLVLLLLDGALASMAAAKEGFEHSETDLRRCELINRHLRKAQRIIAELRHGLNFEAGGDFAPMLNSLYVYYNRRLNEANLQKQVGPVLKVEHLVGQLRDAWAEMLRRPQAAVQPAPAPVLQE